MKTKRWISIMICTLLFICMIPVTALASDEADTWDGSADISWYNEQDTEFHLSTAEQLAGLAELVNNENTFANKTIYLDNDIDLSGYEWISIGTGNNAVGYFGGNFDGQYHSVLNMKTGLSHHGLFGIIFGGTVQNLGVENGNIILDESDSSLRIGLLADWAHNVVIRDCFTTGQITTNDIGDRHIGGLVGEAMFGTQIVGSYSSAVIESKATEWAEAVGGLVGSWETKGEQPMIADCYFDGTITFSGGADGMSTNVGGILGMCFDDEPELIIKNCMVATTDVYAPSDIDIDTGNGGMWIAWYQETGMPENCYWPEDDRAWPACIAFGTYISSNFTDGLYFDECGSSVTDFKADEVLTGLQTNAGQDIEWVEGIDHPTFSWDLRNIPADYTAVETAKNNIPVDLSLYTDESVRVLNAALSNVAENMSMAQQAEVEAMAQAINDAVAALVYRDADYTAVDAAIAAAEALDPLNYKDFSAVEDAINAVVRGKNITEQTEVDAMAQAIEDAINALEEKEEATSNVSDTTQTNDTEKSTSAQSEKKGSATSPKTGADENFALIWVSVLAACAAVLTTATVYKRKRKYSK